MSSKTLTKSLSPQNSVWEFTPGVIDVALFPETLPEATWKMIISMIDDSGKMFSVDIYANTVKLATV
jgi:hypothetical protein